MKINTSIRISRTTSSQKPYDSMTIIVTDDASHLNVLEMRLSMEDFAKCITGMSLHSIPAEIEEGDFRTALGKERQTKTEHIPVFKRDFSKVQKAAKLYEKDGWISNVPSADPYAHRAWGTDAEGNITYAVDFVRWV